MDATSLQAQLVIELKGIASNFVTSDYTTAFTNAANETGWTLPISSDSFRELWFKERAKRWLFFALMTENVESFKVNQLSLNQQFDHLKYLVDQMDKAFEQLKEDNPEKFSCSGIDVTAFFGQVAPAGFTYDDFGADTTYDDED